MQAITQCDLTGYLGLPSLPTICGTVIVNEIIQYFSSRWPVQWFPSLTAPKYRGQLSSERIFVKKSWFRFWSEHNVKYDNMSTEYSEISGLYMCVCVYNCHFKQTFSHLLLLKTLRWSSLRRRKKFKRDIWKYDNNTNI